jgi:hypothetical protein
MQQRVFYFTEPNKYDFCNRIPAIEECELIKRCSAVRGNEDSASAAHIRLGSFLD